MTIPAGLIAPVLGAYAGTTEKTYSDFVTRITALASVVTVGGNAPFDQSAVFRIHTLSVGNWLYGSSWLDFYTDDSSFDGCIQHGLPSEAIAISLSTNNSQVLFTNVWVGDKVTVAVDRNGLLSEAWTLFSSGKCTELLYWDYASSSAKRMVPFDGTGPFDYTW